MRFLPFLVLFAFLCSCRNNSDLLQQRFDKADLQADLNACRKILETAHPSLYDYRSIKEMDALFDSLSAKLTDNSSLQDFYQQLSVISSRIGCYHTGFMLPTAFEDSIRKRKAFFPFPILVEEGKVYNNYNDLMIPFGCELTAINGHKMDSILKVLKKYSAADGFNETYPVNHLELEFARNYFLQFGPSATFDISYKDTSSSPSEYQLNLPAVDYNTILNRNEYPYYHGITGVDFDFYLDEQEIYGVLVLNSFYPEGLSGNDAFRHFLDNSFRTFNTSSSICATMVAVLTPMLLMYMHKLPWTLFATTNRPTPASITFHLKKTIWMKMTRLWPHKLKLHSPQSLPRAKIGFGCSNPKTNCNIPLIGIPLLAKCMC
jgi:hypothetical protein